MNSSNLKRHIRIHAKEQPYSCKERSKDFKQLSSLQSHVHIHAGEDLSAVKNVIGNLNIHLA